MQDTRIDLGWATSGKTEKESRPAGLVPLQWFRRRKTMMLAGLAFFIVVFWLRIMGGVVPWRPSASMFVDPEVAELLRTIPGAVPGNLLSKGDALADAGHGGKNYPSREDLTLVLLKQLRDPSFSFADSQWPVWSTWVEGDGDLPKDTHVQFVTELKRLGNGTEDARLVSNDPHKVFGAPCKLGRETSQADAIHCVFEIVLPILEEGESATEFGGSDTLDELDRQKLLHGILQGADVL
ncbi:hypothetical protein MPSI1_002290 [Malassezia psittaci]|uniref:Uncharacterized protein n=1 Tax=Malassezia psittaci TaxID=1821823 RepID=A0AAF0FFF2_9BASI|nr:hypothetical protein MPSI1_002290 [Malassezia psittaci]